MYKFLGHLKNIVYIVFGVKPDLTFNVIRQWMEMESNMSLITGEWKQGVHYLIFLYLARENVADSYPVTIPYKVLNIRFITLYGIITEVSGGREITM